MMQDEITFELIASEHLAVAQRQEILTLCAAAYEEDFGPYLELLPNAVHLLARQAGTLVSHAAWVTRWLQVNEGKLLQTAYVEAVATAPELQRRGFGSAVMRCIVTYLDDFDIAALSPSEHAFYQRLGWELWRGQLAVRTQAGLIATPEEEVMIYRLPRTPEVSLTELLTIEWREGEVW
jgi:aminoglycoside 2'-N-acetyltransferase I